MQPAGDAGHRLRASRPRAARTSSGAASTSRSGTRPVSPSSSRSGSAATASFPVGRDHLHGRATDRHVQHLTAQVEPHRELAVERARHPRRDQQHVGHHRQLLGCVRRGAAQRLGDVALVHQRVEQGVQQDPRPRLPADRAADQHVRAERLARVDHRAGCCARRRRASPPARPPAPPRATPTASSSGRTPASARTARPPGRPRRCRPSPRSSARRAGPRRAPTIRRNGSAASTRRAARRARPPAGAPARCGSPVPRRGRRGSGPPAHATSPRLTVADAAP